MYNGKKLILKDTLELPSSTHEFLIVFLQTESNWKQGIFISTDGEFIYKNHIFKDNLILWERNSPETVTIHTISKSKKLEIYNVWDRGDGVVRKCEMGSAMYVQESFNKTRHYSCNDGFVDDNLKDLVFKLMW